MWSFWDKCLFYILILWDANSAATPGNPKFVSGTLLEDTPGGHSCRSNQSYQDGPWARLHPSLSSQITSVFYCQSCKKKEKKKTWHLVCSQFVFFFLTDYCTEEEARTASAPRETRWLDGRIGSHKNNSVEGICAPISYDEGFYLTFTASYLLEVPSFPDFLLERLYNEIDWELVLKSQKLNKCRGGGVGRGGEWEVQDERVTSPEQRRSLTSRRRKKREDHTDEW